MLIFRKFDNLYNLSIEGELCFQRRIAPLPNPRDFSTLEQEYPLLSNRLNICSTLNNTTPPPIN